MIAVMTMSGDLLGNFVGLSLEPAKGGGGCWRRCPRRWRRRFGITSGSCRRTPRWLVLKATNDAMVARGGAGKGNGMVDDEWTGDDLRLEDARASVAVLRNETVGAASFSFADACLRRKKRAAAAALLVPPDPARQTPEKLDEIEREIDDIVDVIKTTSGDGRDCVSAVDGRRLDAP